jgi:hypothetical protein
MPLGNKTISKDKTMKRMIGWLGWAAAAATFGEGIE